MMRRGLWWCDMKVVNPRLVICIGRLSVSWYAGGWAFGLRPRSSWTGFAFDLFNIAVVWKPSYASW